MLAGELLIELGLEGAEATVGGISKATEGLKNMKGSALETKAEVLALVFAFGRLVQMTGQLGQSIANFGSSTGLSESLLQRFQYAFRRVGASDQETTSSLSSLYKQMTEMFTSRTMPANWGLVASKSGGIDFAKVLDPYYMMGKLQQFARSAPKELVFSTLSSMGFSPNMIAGFREGVINKKTLGGAPVVSDKDAKALRDINVAWSDLFRTIELDFIPFIKEQGPEVIRDLNELVKGLLAFAKTIKIILDVFAVSQWIHLAARVAGGILQGYGNINDLSSHSEEIKEWWNSPHIPGSSLMDLGSPTSNGVPSDALSRFFSAHAGMPLSPQQINVIVHMAPNATMKEMEDALSNAFKQSNKQTKN